MCIHPKRFILVFILANAFTLGLISLRVNSGYAQSRKQTRQEASPIIAPALSTRFPEEIQQWRNLIEIKADEFSIDPNLIAAVIMQESGGNPAAISSSGAVGLMQVMPGDGNAMSFQCINGPCFAQRPSTSSLLDPEFNVFFGSRLLSTLISRTSSVREALRAYGPMDVGYQYADLVLAIHSQFSM